MGSERITSREAVRKTPDSIFLLAHLATFGGIGDIVVLATVAARLKRAGIDRVGLGYKNIEAQAQVVRLISSRIDFQPLPAGLFDQSIPFSDRLQGYRDSLEFQKHLMIYERIALLGASQVRFVMKSPLRFKVDVFPQDVYFQNKPIVDNFTLQLGKRYQVEEFDHGPVEFSISRPLQDAVSLWAREKKFDLSSPFWVINLCAGTPEKTWSLPKFVTLSEWLNRHAQEPVVFINPPENFKKWHPLIEFLKRAPQNLFFASAEIGANMALIKRAKGYIGGDTGLTHIAAALGTPLVIIYPEVNLHVWKPVTAGQEISVVSAETIDKITPAQVINPLEARFKI